MDVTRMSIARVLELGVATSWQNATPRVFEGVSKAHGPVGTARRRGPPHAFALTRRSARVRRTSADQAHARTARSSGLNTVSDGN